MKGKVVSTGSPKSGTEVIANRLLQAAGLDPAKDIKAQRLDLTKTVDGMKDGRIDALVWSGGLPTPAMTDLFQSLGGDVKLIDISPLLPKLQETNSVYVEGTIPKATYKTPADVKTIVVPNLLLVRSDMPESRACALTKLVFDHKADLVKVHPAAADITVEQAPKTEPVQLHPGSETALEQVS
jgi:TRAP transporter TAXI family solute receptor